MNDGGGTTATGGGYDAEGGIVDIGNEAVGGGGASSSQGGNGGVRGPRGRFIRLGGGGGGGHMEAPCEASKLHGVIITGSKVCLGIPA